MRKTDQDAALVAKSNQTLLLLASPQCVECVADHLFLSYRIVVAVGRRIGRDSVAERVDEQRDDHREFFTRYRSRIPPHFHDRETVDRFHLDCNFDPGSTVEVVKRLHVLVDSAHESAARSSANRAANYEVE